MPNMSGAMSEVQSPGEAARVKRLYHFARLQLPRLTLTPERFQQHLERTYQIFTHKTPATWTQYLDGLYLIDWLVAVGCLTGQTVAWEMLFAARTGRSDCLLVDALRARACRLYPRDEEKQETSVTEFWSALIASEREGSLPILARYDGVRPLSPWLIRVFQNRHLSELRSSAGISSLPDDDIAQPIPTTAVTETRWHEAFCEAARSWLHSLSDAETILLGLRWRYKQTQREVATILKVHEGTITRQIDKLRDRALAVIGEDLLSRGWTGDDLEAFILTEMAGLMVDEPTLSADHLRRLLQARGSQPPA
jgi:RNA polymerase sigma factor (sigma-70 family)